MMTISLGVIETVGFTAAIHAADAACKAAGVSLAGYRKAGSGLVSVYFEGEISAVKAAVDSGLNAIREQSASNMALVMARPDSSVLAMLARGPILHAVADESELKVPVEETVIQTSIEEEVIPELTSMNEAVQAESIKANDGENKTIATNSLSDSQPAETSEPAVPTAMEQQPAIAKETQEETPVTNEPKRKPASSRRKRASATKSQGSKK
ncbi:BMC domain-containing protein [Photobacterium sanguinicancri]|uniref:BMC domain-containing protein n=1 Tax=Photobacterium sanguinicancri TaxID=875932 RepID=UPI0026E11D02|nr:BMC domain-containing protein [Photobacterium sanguinicancri]MDO6500898.1 BMC domain-containing protein [Photobacterium sanguinicancri]